MASTTVAHQHGPAQGHAEPRRRQRASRRAAPLPPVPRPGNEQGPARALVWLESGQRGGYVDGRASGCGQKRNSEARLRVPKAVVQHASKGGF